MLQGTRFPGCAAVVEVLKQQGGQPQATVLSHRVKLPATSAALAGGMFGGICDQADCDDATATHVGPMVVPAALASAEARRATTGRDLITAVALGADVLLRLARARTSSAYVSGITPSLTFGIFGAAAAAGKLLGLDENALYHAFGLAFSQGPVPIRGYMTSPKIMYGVRAAAGIQCALLAQAGVCGPPQAMEAANGHWRAFEHEEVRPEAITDGLGEKFFGATSSIKRFPGTKHTHGPVQTIIDLARRHDIQPYEVAEIRVRGNTPLYNFHHTMVRHGRGAFTPLMGLALVDRRLDADNLFSYQPDLYTPHLYAATKPVTRPEVDRIADLVSVILDDKIARLEPKNGVGPVVVEILLQNGVSHRQRVATARGHHTRSPVSDRWLAGEFRREAARAAHPLTASKIASANRQLLGLAELDDVAPLMRLLA